MDKQTLAQLLSDNRIDDLFDALKTKAHQHLDELILLESEWNDLGERERSGILSADQLNLESARIRKKLLDLIDLVTSPPDAAAPPAHHPATAAARRWIWVLGGLLALAIGYILFKPTAPDTTAKPPAAAAAKGLDVSAAQPVTIAAGDTYYERVYRVVATAVESTGGGKSLITLRVGMHFKGTINIGFGSDSFRLLAAELPGPLAPSNFFAEVVDAKSYKEQDVKFELSDQIKRFSVVIEGKEDKKWEFSR